MYRFYVWAINSSTQNRIYLKSVKATNEADAIRMVKDKPPKFVDYQQGTLSNFVAYKGGIVH